MPGSVVLLPLDHSGNYGFMDYIVQIGLLAPELPLYSQRREKKNSHYKIKTKHVKKLLNSY